MSASIEEGNVAPAADAAAPAADAAAPAAVGAPGDERRGPLLLLLSWLSRLVLAGVFLFAGFQKAADPAAFAEQIANYQLLSEWAAWGAVLLPSIELAAAATVLVAPPPWRRGAVLVLLGLLAVFTGAIIQAWARGIDTDCGCFGQGSTPIGILSVLRNSGLMLACGVLLWLTPRSTQRRLLRFASVR